MNTKTIKILVTEPMAADGLAQLRSQSGFSLDVNLTLSEEALLDKIPDFDCLLVRSQTKVNKNLIDRGQKLKLIGRAGVGVDNIDINHAQQRNIAVINTPSGNSISAAELAFGLMVSLARKLPFAHQHVQQGLWDRGSFKGLELYKKTLGIIGFGNVGQHLYKRAKAFDMQVLVFDPLIKAQDGIEIVSLEEVLKRSDFLSLHCALNDQTRNIINQHSMSLLKKGAILINTARGELIEDEALIAGLDNGQLAFAALDVFRNEPPAKNNPLLHHPRIMVTPHLGASTEEAQIRVSNLLAQETIAFFNGEKVKRVV